MYLRTCILFGANLLMSLSFTYSDHSMTIPVYEPHEEWNFQQCQRTGIHLRHPISHEFVYETLCEFPSSRDHLLLGILCRFLVTTCITDAHFLLHWCMTLVVLSCVLGLQIKELCFSFMSFVLGQVHGPFSEFSVSKD